MRTPVVGAPGEGQLQRLGVAVLGDPRLRLHGPGLGPAPLGEQRCTPEDEARRQAGYQRIVELIAEGIVLAVLGTGGLQVELANAAAVELLGGSRGGGLEAFMAGREPFASLYDERGRTLSRDDLPDRRTVAGHGTADRTVWGWRDAAGRMRWVSSSSRPVLDEAGALVGVVLSLMDVTERHELRMELGVAHARFAALVAHSSDATCIVDPVKGVVTYATPSYEVVCGEPIADRIGRPIGERIHPADRPRAYEAMEQLLAQPEQAVRVDLRFVDPSGGIRHLEVTATNRLAEPAIAGFVMSCHDVTARVLAAERLADDTRHDPLTGLANRLLLLERLGEAIEEAERTGEHCALLYLDLDRFKYVNDSFGHAFGDQLLVAIAGRLSKMLRRGHPRPPRRGRVRGPRLAPLRARPPSSVAEAPAGPSPRPCGCPAGRSGGPARSGSPCRAGARAPTSCSSRPTPPSTGRRPGVEELGALRRGDAPGRPPPPRGGGLDPAGPRDRPVGVHYQPDRRPAKRRVVGAEALARLGPTPATPCPPRSSSRPPRARADRPPRLRGRPPVLREAGSWLSATRARPPRSR